jgi:hypothetical protein
VSIGDLIARHLPCPPDPLPERNLVADYLWRATLFNAQQNRIRRVVKLSPKFDVVTDPLPPINVPIPIVRVECDELGRGVRVL